MVFDLSIFFLFAIFDSFVKLKSDPLSTRNFDSFPSNNVDASKIFASGLTVAFSLNFLVSLLYLVEYEFLVVLIILFEI